MGGGKRGRDGLVALILAEIFKNPIKQFFNVLGVSDRVQSLGLNE
jgi:hypothetical protein